MHTRKKKKNKDKRVDEDLSLHHSSYTSLNGNYPQVMIVSPSRAPTPFRTVYSTIKRVGKQGHLLNSSPCPLTIDVGGQITSRPHTSICVQAFDQRYVPIGLLGAAGNGEVNFYKDTKIGTLVAVKTVHHGVPKSPPEAYMANFLDQYSNIVRYHSGQENYKQLIFEYCPLGDLANYTSIFNDDIPGMFTPSSTSSTCLPCERVTRQLGDQYWRS
jgi:hypothetical protein